MAIRRLAQWAVRGCLAFGLLGAACSGGGEREGDHGVDEGDDAVVLEDTAEDADDSEDVATDTRDAAHDGADPDTQASDGIAEVPGEDAVVADAGDAPADLPLDEADDPLEQDAGADAADAAPDPDASAGDVADAVDPGGPGTFCTLVPPLETGETCQVTAGAAGMLLSGHILLPGDVLRGGQVSIDADGFISCVGCDCETEAAGATRVVCPAGVISPGLINLSDHNVYYLRCNPDEDGVCRDVPYDDTGERYEQRNDWRYGTFGHNELISDLQSSLGSAPLVQWNELRHTIAGVTSTAGPSFVDGFLRNLRSQNFDEGLDGLPVQYSTFPLDNSNGMLRNGDCYYGSAPDTPEALGPGAYLAEVAVGIDVWARNEFLCTSGLAEGGQDLLVPRAAFVHAIGLLASDYALMADEGAGLVWTPRNDIALYGDTARVTLADTLGVEIGLGAQWLATGSSNLLRELRCADELNRIYFDGHFENEDLWSMVTRRAAELAGVADLVGTLSPGLAADIAVFDGSSHPYHRAILDAEPSDVALVLRGGQVLYGDAGIVAELPGTGTCDELDVCGTDKQLCAEADIGMSLAELHEAIGLVSAGSEEIPDVYPAFFCGVPAGEPTCTPRRQNIIGLPDGSVNGSSLYTGEVSEADADGDGIVDGSDVCPGVFDPVRPLDNGAQADFDDDGLGDACDPCPLGPCPASVYDIKSGAVAAGTEVSLDHALVTAHAAAGNGFFVQVHEADGSYIGPDYSGIFVFEPGTTVQVGDRVDIGSATVADFFGEIQLGFVTGIEVESTGGAAPAPTLVSAEDIATGGSRADALEGVLVQIEDVVVTDAAPDPAAGDPEPTREFEVDGVLRINDFLYETSPHPEVGEAYGRITGVLHFHRDNSKLEPRSADDLILAPD